MSQKLCISVLLLAVFCSQAHALSGFVDVYQFLQFDPFAVATEVDFTTPIYNSDRPIGSNINYYTTSNYLAQGSFPLLDMYAAEYQFPIPQNFAAGGTNDLYGITRASDQKDMIVARSTRNLIGLDFFSPVQAMGFYLSDTIDHYRYFSTPYNGEYITRVVQDSFGSYSLYYSGFSGVQDVFIGYINDVTGFQALFAGWYTNARVIGSERDVDSANYRGEYNGMFRMLSPAAYVGAGGDPHLISRSIGSEMTNILAGDIVNLVDHAQVTVNAEVREFDFLPQSMRQNNYFGRLAARLDDGRLVVVSAFEDQAQQPAYSVTVDGVDLALGDVVDDATGAYRIRYDVYENLEGAHGESWFAEQFPFQEHTATVRIWVFGEVVVDVSLSSKTAFIDWHQSQPRVYHQAGAFLNVNMRDLSQAATSTGLLKAVDNVHMRKKMRDRALANGTTLQVRDIDVDFDEVVSAVVDQHRVGSLF